MANWCDYHVGFNSDSLVDLVTEESLKEVFDTEEPDWAELDEEWSDKGYGFCIPMNFENENVCDGQITNSTLVQRKSLSNYRHDFALEKFEKVKILDCHI